jgi:hypothetical protein
VEHYPSGYEENFEIILLDPAYYTTPTGDGEIIVQYLNAMQQDDNTLGIESPDQYCGIQYFRDAVYHPLAIEITDGFALRYTTFKPGQTGIDEYIASKEANQPISLQVNPNPFSNLTQIRYSILDTRYSIENPTLNIFDASGRLVKSYNLESSIQNQESAVFWDGCDDTGRKLPSGIYFARFDTKDASGTAKIILVD